MPAIAYEDVGVGEFINKMTTDPERVMELLGRLVKMTCRAIVVVLILYLAVFSEKPKISIESLKLNQQEKILKKK
jgi:hypothetical protein